MSPPNRNLIIITQSMPSIQAYTQMGYTAAEVGQAYKLSARKQIEMLDALQAVRNSKPAAQRNKTLPSFSYLVPIKNIKMTEFETLYSQSGLKLSHGKQEIRSVDVPVGLLNVSNCCYLNSLLQCYFLLGNFVREILKAEPIDDLSTQFENKTRSKRISEEFKLLEALKQMFAKLKLSSRKYLDPTAVLANLVNSVGEKIAFGDEKDLNEINMCIIERLSECLVYTKQNYSKSVIDTGSLCKVVTKENIKKLFYGEKIEYIEGCEQDSTATDFMGLILNPRDQDLMSALDSEFNYDVEIDGKLVRKRVLIRSLPQYLFISINRTGYEKIEKQLLKNEDKMDFDFIVYFDRFLQKNKEDLKITNPKIKQLLTRKKQITKQLNHLTILENKLMECREHAKYLTGWNQKLPEQSAIESQRSSFLEEINAIETELTEIDSRNEKYSLVYLFVHRGDAVSGHYWGYGRNGKKWYRFDINCSPINQSDILVDLQKSGGIPYAMVYTRDSEIQSFPYSYYTSEQSIGLQSDLLSNDYSDYIAPKTRHSIITDNISLHTAANKQRNTLISNKILINYKTKYNVVKSQCEKFQVNSGTPNYINFTCYLQTIGESQLMKYHVYEMSLLAEAELTPKELLKNDKLLQKVQKMFRKKIKGKMAMRHFSISSEPVENQRYEKLKNDYIIGKKAVKLIRVIRDNLGLWPNSQQVHKIMNTMTELIVNASKKISISKILTQLHSILLIDLALAHKDINKDWVQIHKESILKSQLQQLNSILIQSSEVDKYDISAQIEQKWDLQDLKKQKYTEFIEDLHIILASLSEAVKIYKVNSKDNKIHIVNQEKNQDLI